MDISQNNLQDDSISKYEETMFFKIRTVLIIVFLIQISQAIALYIWDFSNDSFFIEGRWTSGIQYWKRHVIAPSLCNILSYLLSSILRNQFPSIKKWILTFEMMFLASVQCFFHWGFVWMSVLYMFPLIVVCPFEHKYNRTTFFGGLLCCCIYTIYQIMIHFSMYHIYTLGTITGCMVMANSARQSIYKSFNDMVDAHKKLELKNREDNLTKLLNKNAYLSDIESNVIKCKCVAFIDIDNFKKINDEKSHDIGDLIIKMLANHLSKIDNTIVYRFGGDEFVLFSKYNTDKLKVFLDEKREDFKKESAETIEMVSFSAGIVPYREYIDNLRKIVDNADATMYKAKKNGKGYTFVDNYKNI